MQHHISEDVVIDNMLPEDTTTSLSSRECRFSISPGTPLFDLLAAIHPSLTKLNDNEQYCMAFLALEEESDFTNHEEETHE